MPHEVSQSEKDKYCSDLIYLGNLKESNSELEKVKGWWPGAEGQGKQGGVIRGCASSCEVGKLWETMSRVVTQ